MKERIIGTISRINGPVITAEGISNAMMMELVHAGESRLVGEVVKLRDEQAIIQVYEDTTGVKPGEPIYGSGLPLSVELGPGLIGNIYDGIQRPLVQIKEKTGVFIDRGVDIPALNREKIWHFIPTVKTGETLEQGQIIGTVVESQRIEHRILVPPGIRGVLSRIVEEGEYSVDYEIASVKTETGEQALTMMQRWPIRKPRPVSHRRVVDEPLITGQRVIDTLFPVGKGGTVAIPGGFGTGKTMTQHAVAKWS
ncbi:MAG: V-type ATP synthase subunit A, partial [Spirochaetes bacterium]